MFLVEKTHLTSHFKLISKKPSPVPKGYQQAARSFDEKVIFHLKTLIPPSDMSILSLNWMSKAVSFLSMVHVEAQEQISKFRSESECCHALYMDYSQKVLDLSNLISSAVQQLVERRLLLNLSLRLLTSSGEIPSPEKMKKAKDVLIRSVNNNIEISKDKGKRAKDLVEELTFVVNSLPIGKTTSGRDLIRRTLHGLGVLTVFVTGVLVSVLYGRPDLVEVRVPTEFVWADSVAGVQRQVFDLIKPRQASDGGEKKSWLSEVDDTADLAVALCDVIDEVAAGGDGDSGEKDGGRLVDGVEGLRKAVGKFSDGVDELTNGVNGLFSGVLKTRNGVLDGVRKCEW